jgi:hypothetical protein
MNLSPIVVLMLAFFAGGVFLIKSKGMLWAGLACVALFGLMSSGTDWGNSLSNELFTFANKF